MVVRTIFLKLVLVSVTVLAASAFTSAQTTQLPNIHYMSSWLNFTRGQAVTLNFTNVDSVPRNVSLNFLDAYGNLLKTANARVLSGQTVSLSFSFSDFDRTSSTRVGIRGVAVVVDPPDANYPPSPELGIVGMELFEVQSSKTLIGLLLPAVRNANVFFPMQP